MSHLNLRGVHVYEKIPGQSTFRLKETHPAMRLSRDMQVLYIQDGTVFAEGGEEVKELPAWFNEEVQKASPTALREVGLVLKRKEKAE